MYKNILIATDGSRFAEKGVRHGVMLAKALAARVTVVTVSEPLEAIVMLGAGTHFPSPDYIEADARSAAGTLAVAQEIAKAMGVACETVHVSDVPPAEGIVGEAQKRGTDLIVMASHGRRGVSRLLLGSQANKVVTHSKVPVLICR